jgi:predicted dehydrogenase
MLDALRYGIIGSGMMGQEHIRNIALLPGAKVTAISDPHGHMREAAASLAVEAKTFSDHRQLLDSGLADVLVIASPNHTHAAILADALCGEWPIMLEKPLATTLADSARIAAMARGRKAPVWVAMEYRYMPAVARLIELAHSGAAGPIRLVSIREHRYPFLNKVGHWNRFARLSGGTLVEKCCHFFDLMRLVLRDEAVRVFASGAADVNHRDESYGGETPDIIDNALVVVDFAGGARAMLELCMFAEGSYFQEEIAAIGDAAKLEAKVPGPGRFLPEGEERQGEFIVSPRATKTPMREITHVDPGVLSAGDHHGSTYFQHLRFMGIVRNGGEPEVTVEDGLRAVEIGLAAEQSVKSGQPVQVGGPSLVETRDKTGAGGFAA